MLVSQVLNCNFSSWYNQFSRVTFESDIIKLPQEFINYLLSDGIYLPKSCQVNEESSDWSDDDNQKAEDDQVNISVDFPEIEEKIKSSINRFGCVFAKLNWSSPQDAQWITPNGTKCRELSDVYLLLKCSDFIVHDLTEPFEHCCDREEHNDSIQYELVLRRWVDINPSIEFRCFVVNNKLIGISQRDLTAFYNYIGNEKEDIILDIAKFFNNNIKNKFSDSNYIFDVCRFGKDNVTLIDFNPFGLLSCPKLFSYDELQDLSMAEKELQFRYIADKTGILPQNFANYALPLEAIQAKITLASEILNYIDKIER